MEQPLLFSVMVRCEDEAGYRAFAEQAARLKPLGRVMMNVDTLAEPTPYGLECPSPWHQYLDHLPGLVKVVPHPNLQPYLDMKHVERNKELMLKQALRDMEGELTLLSHELTMYLWEIPAVEGQAKNTGGDKLGQVLIRVAFKDSSGTVLKTAEDTKESLFPGEIWDFRVICEGEDPSAVVDYEIVVP